MTSFSTIQLDRNNKMKELVKKLREFLNANPALEKFISEMKETAEQQLSFFRDKYHLWKPKPNCKKASTQYTSYSLSVEFDLNENYAMGNPILLYWLVYWCLRFPTEKSMSDRHLLEKIFLFCRQTHRLFANRTNITQAVVSLYVNCIYFWTVYILWDLMKSSFHKKWCPNFVSTLREFGCRHNGNLSCQRIYFLNWGPKK